MADQVTMRWLRTWWLALVGTALVVAGVITVLVAQLTPTASFGWYAYAPLAHTTFIAPATSRSVPIAIGVVLLVAGAVLDAGVIGYRLGVRKARVK